MERNEVRLKLVEAMLPVCSKYDILKNSMVELLKPLERYVMGDQDAPIETPEIPPPSRLKSKVKLRNKTLLP